MEWNHLKNIVQRNKNGVEACLAVVDYLQLCNIGASQGIIFSLSDNSGTFDFIDRYCTVNPHIEKFWLEEKKADKEREDAYWIDILRRKAELVELRSSLASTQASMKAATYSKESLQSQLMLLEISNVSTRSDISARQSISSRIGNEQAKINSLSSTISQLESSISLENSAPEYVRHPLPSNRSFGLKILFFLFFMPEELNYLTKFIINAQEMLIHENEKFAKITRNQISWQEYYASHSGMFPQQLNFLVLKPINLEYPKNIGPAIVDSLISASQKMWYPDFASQFTTLKDEDPMAVSPELVRLKFTEKLRNHNLQWMIEFPVDMLHCDRGNVVHTIQHLKDLFLKDDSLGKHEFIALSNLRSFSSIQIRRLISILERRRIPLNNQNIAILVKQVLYQVGEFTDSTPKLVWKTDFFDFGGREALVNAISKWLKILETTPRDFLQLPLLAELTAWVYQYKDDDHVFRNRASISSVAPIPDPTACICLDLQCIGGRVDQTFTVISIWIEDIKLQIGKDIRRNNLGLRAKLCIMYGYNIIMFGNAKLNMANCEALLTALIGFRHNLVYTSVSSTLNVHTSNDRFKTWLMLKLIPWVSA